MKLTNQIKNQLLNQFVSSIKSRLLRLQVKFHQKKVEKLQT